VTVENAGPGDAPLRVEVSRVEGTKCVRCWRYVPEVAGDETYAGLCSRCVEAVSEMPASARQ
jgi:isoleucyl-tRNA synthetase